MGKTSIIGEGIAAYSLKDDNGEPYLLYTKMAYAPNSKYRLMAPQWLGMQDKEQGVPKEKRCRCELDDEEAVLYLDERKRKVTIKHDPKMLVPVLNVNLGIKNFESFNVAFHNVIQGDALLSDDLFTFDTDEDDEITGVALRSIDEKAHLSKYLDAADIIAKNADLEDKLLQIQQDVKQICTKDTLDRNQRELLQLHECFNHVISITDLQLLAAAGHFPKRLSTCTRPACATCCYGKARKKPWRSKGKHNKAILDCMRKLPGEIAYTNIMTSSVPGLIPQMVGFLTSRKFHYISFFVDDSSDYTFVHHQESTSADDTILAKRAYEAELRKYG